MPDRSIAICKELTKINEFVFRGVSKNVKNYVLQKKENLKIKKKDKDDAKDDHTKNKKINDRG